jgi:GH15 family glucan-1,4-alpha-glucosidase
LGRVVATQQPGVTPAARATDWYSIDRYEGCAGLGLRIEDYALIGDTHTAALVGTDGSLDWLCLPRFDSAAIFSALLGGPRHGRWLLAPAAAVTGVSRRYRGDTLVLETQWRTEHGTVRVVDAMPVRDPVSEEAPSVVRIVQGLSGRVTMRCELVARFDYGGLLPWVRHTPAGMSAVGGPDAVWLRTPVRLHGRDFATVADFEVGAGEQVPFVLTWQPSHRPAPPVLEAGRAVADTEAWWRDWMAGCRYDGQWQQPVRRSLLTLKALTYAPSGGIVAAPTTSLPEKVGGVRNWDYRYCWLRDATFALQALLYTGFTAEARAWRAWLMRAVAGDPAKLQILYGIGAERRLPEWQADWLPGYAGSAPVRVGNAAATQFQLDVFGEVFDTLHLARTAGLEPDGHNWALQRVLLDFLAEHWADPDEGIWEVRGPRRHFTHSKMMAWVALDRAIRSAQRFGLPGPLPRWRQQREQIHAEVCERGYDPRRGTFTMYYGSAELDAALLMMPLVGFLPADDPRVAGTITAIEQHLMHDGLVHRYTQPPEQTGTPVDGLPAGEAAFLACSFWLADAYALTGRPARARELFEHLLSLRNDVGLLAEEYDTTTGRQLGNFPQAFSHVPLIETARTLSTRGGPAHPRRDRT